MNEAEEMAERLMKLPRHLVKQTSANSTMIEALIKQQERLLELICKLHDIDLDEYRKDIMV